MSPEFKIRDRLVVVDVYHAGGETSIFPRVKMGQTMAAELQKEIGGKAWVRFDPSMEYTPINFLDRDLDLQEVLGKIECFLRTNDSRWFLPRT